MPKNFVEVLLDQNLATPLDYAIPEGWEVQIGMRVEVPVKSHLKKGTVSCLKDNSPFKQIKFLAKILSSTAELSDSQWKLAEWMSRYYTTQLQRVLKCFVPANIRNETKSKKQIFLTLAIPHFEAFKQCEALRGKEPIHAEILDRLLHSKKGIFLNELMEELKISRSPVNTLIKKKVIASQLLGGSEDLLLEEEFFSTQPKTLNPEQKSCLNAIETSLLENRFTSHLIHGVTGSGKTEVYLQAIGKALEMGKSAILLVPEVSLTSQTIERFRARFSEKLAILHHRRSAGEKNECWFCPTGCFY